MIIETRTGGLVLETAHWIAWSSPILAALVLLGGIVWVWRTWVGARRVQESLAGRVCVELVPTSTFDPGEREVARWARHLGRVRYAVGKTPSRGAGVRLRYSAEAGRMHCYLEGPAAADAVLAMPGFAEVEVRSARSRRDIKPVTFTLPASVRGEK
ncbi:hypothetical protein [Streptomyces sp. NBC_01465]|uniref:hypothetical protein n=1 Tax=Streptomyces sp. NBC_01465 TaxID=2903878 RepID=UPI002E2EFE7D|nr:hypothetical protein [Streptomyces sp. NBC_01465]